MAKRTYTNGNIVVYWDSDLCTKCTNCHSKLPAVFNPEARPWVNLDGAPADEIMDVVNECPSGALKVEVIE